MASSYLIDMAAVALLLGLKVILHEADGYRLVVFKDDVACFFYTFTQTQWSSKLTSCLAEGSSKAQDVRSKG